MELELTTLFLLYIFLKSRRVRYIEHDDFIISRLFVRATAAQAGYGVLERFALQSAVQFLDDIEHLQRLFAHVCGRPVMRFARWHEGDAKRDIRVY